MNEKTIKRWWLGISLAYPSFLLLSVSYLFIELTNVKDADFAKKLSPIMITFYQSIFLSLIGFLILYFCSYKKPGTRILTFSLFSQFFRIPYQIYALGMLQSALTIMTSSKTPIPGEAISFFYSVQAISFCCIFLSIIWLFFSFKLRAINKTAQLNRMLAVPEYLKAFLSLREASDYKNLCERYGNSVRENPEFAGHLKKAFKEKKTLLNSSSFS